MNVLGVDVDLTNIENAFVECSFEPGYNCTIEYGTDPAYTTSDTSTTLAQVTILSGKWNSFV